MTRVVMVVPRREGVAERDRSWAWARSWWERELPEVEIFEGHHDGDGPFNISAARNRAAVAADADASPWDVAVFADSDTFCDAEQLRTAVARAHSTGEQVIGFTRFRYLTQAGSEVVLAGGNPRRQPVRFTYQGGVSSLVAIPRPLFNAVGGWDERFVGWGEEDAAMAVACGTFGPNPERFAGARSLRDVRDAVPRVSGDCWHLWHPVSETNDPDLPGYQANVDRRRRYVAAAGDRDAVRAIIEEETV